MPLTARVETRVRATITNPLDLTVPVSEVDPPPYRQDYANGTGAEQANMMFSDQRTVNASSTDTLDLAGVLTQPLGGTLAFTAIKEIILVAADANPGNLRLGKQLTNGFVGPFDATVGALGVTVAPGGRIHLGNPSAAGWAVTASTGDLLTVENLSAGGPAVYDIYLIGEV